MHNQLDLIKQYLQCEVKYLHTAHLHQLIKFTVIITGRCGSQYTIQNKPEM